VELVRKMGRVSRAMMALAAQTAAKEEADLGNRHPRTLPELRDARQRCRTFLAPWLSIAKS
jgi:hypothetical protein